MLIINSRCWSIVILTTSSLWFFIEGDLFTLRISIRINLSSVSLPLEGKFSSAIFVDPHVCEGLENLLKCGLTHRILADFQIRFLPLDEAEDKPDGLVALGDPKFVIVVVVFEYLDSWELFAQGIHDFQASLLNLLPE